MTHQEKLNLVRQWVISAVPEIVELKWGCRYRRKAIKGRWFDHVLDHHTDWQFVCGCARGTLTTQAFTTFKCGLCREGKSWPNGAPPKWCIECAKERSVCPYCKTGLEILGRPISLEDVLQAAGILTYIIASWHLGRPLDEQSPETIDFLYSLAHKS